MSENKKMIVEPKALQDLHDELTEVATFLDKTIKELVQESDMLNKSGFADKKYLNLNKVINERKDDVENLSSKIREFTIHLKELKIKVDDYLSSPDLPNININL